MQMSSVYTPASEEQLKDHIIVIFPQQIDPLITEWQCLRAAIQFWLRLHLAQVKCVFLACHIVADFVRDLKFVFRKGTRQIFFTTMAILWRFGCIYPISLRIWNIAMKILAQPSSQIRVTSTCYCDTANVDFSYGPFQAVIESKKILINTFSSRNWTVSLIHPH